jgi:SAM-dependent methyltransferase
MSLQNIKTGIEFVRERADDLAKRLNISKEDIEKRLELPNTTDMVVALEALGMSYQVPFYCKDSSIKVDAIISHTVFEHIPQPILQPLLREMRLMLRPGGMISHCVDNSDHREHIDSRLSRVDFLRFSDRVWEKICLHPQSFTNRLRHSDYVRMVEEAGYHVVIERAYQDERSRVALEKMRLANRFRGYNEVELTTIHSQIIARPRDDLCDATV